DGANATSSTSADLPAMAAEFKALTAEMKNIVDNTSFGGQNLLEGTKGAFRSGNVITFQIGATAAEKYVFKTSKALDLTAGTLGTLDTNANANAAITKVNTAIETLGSLRSELGAGANRLEHTYNNLGNMIQNTSAAKGRIMDVDYATETSNMTSKQMLMQASTSMLKQSNSMSQMVASLLQ
ncbi:MAG: Lateral flagellin, partial [Comamonas sp.]|nr:Lateral flagellin [Candidatus Comamonas equi]